MAPIRPSSGSASDAPVWARAGSGGATLPRGLIPPMGAMVRT